MITVSEIAQICGVSKVTASRVLNNNTKFKISPTTRDKILEAAKRFNYRPNRVASSFSTGNTYTIGLIGYSLVDHFLGGIFTGVHETLYPEGYDFQMLMWSDDARKEDRLLQSVVDRRLDGVVFAMGNDDHDYRYLMEWQSYGIPVVAVDREVPLPNICFVGSDDFGGAMDIVEYLISMGHSDIAFIGSVTRKGHFPLSSIKRRYEGYRECMLKKGLVPQNVWEIKRSSERLGYRETLSEYLRMPDRPTAVFVENDALAADMIIAADELGLKIPDDLSVAGFSNEPVAELVSPGLTTVKQNPFEIGQKAAEMLLKRMEMKSKGVDLAAEQAEAILLPTELVIRKSVKKTV